MENVSVLIRVKNEERWIGNAIQSALDHLQSPEIIVIDNNSTDSSLEIVKSFRHNPALEKSQKRYTNVSILNIDEYSPGKSLNMGVAHAQFENILILSALYNYRCQILNIYRISCPIWMCFWQTSACIQWQENYPRYLWSHFGDEQVINMYSSSEERYFMHNAFPFLRSLFLPIFHLMKMLLGRKIVYGLKHMLKIRLNICILQNA